MDTIDLHPVIESGRVVYAAPLGPQIAVVVLTVAAVLALVVLGDRR